MFSGIVEAQARVLAAGAEQGLVRIDVEKPEDFNDLKNGDSICSNGVCLTVESFDAHRIRFALGEETLKITGWTVASLLSPLQGANGVYLNLERSLRLGERIHGHMVSGHVDTTGEIVLRQDLGGSLLLNIRVPGRIGAYLWPKGSWAVNGVSLTINSVTPDDQSGVVASVCLIPETVKRTNLGTVALGAHVNVEVDMMARGLIHYFENSGAVPDRGLDSTPATSGGTP